MDSDSSFPALSYIIISGLGEGGYRTESPLPLTRLQLFRGKRKPSFQVFYDLSNSGQAFGGGGDGTRPFHIGYMVLSSFCVPKLSHEMICS